jgi:hypothetical protein
VHGVGNCHILTIHILESLEKVLLEVRILMWRWDSGRKRLSKLYIDYTITDGANEEESVGKSKKISAAVQEACW